MRSCFFFSRLGNASRYLWICRTSARNQSARRCPRRSLFLPRSSLTEWQSPSLELHNRCRHFSDSSTKSQAASAPLEQGREAERVGSAEASLEIPEAKVDAVKHKKSVRRRRVSRRTPSSWGSTKHSDGSALSDKGVKLIRLPWADENSYRRTEENLGLASSRTGTGVLNNHTKEFSQSQHLGTEQERPNAVQKYSIRKYNSNLNDGLLHWRPSWLGYSNSGKEKAIWDVTHNSQGELLEWHPIFDSNLSPSNTVKDNATWNSMPKSQDKLIEWTPKPNPQQVPSGCNLQTYSISPHVSTGKTEGTVSWMADSIANPDLKPLNILTRWLELNDISETSSSEKELFWYRVGRLEHANELPTILVGYLDSKRNNSGTNVVARDSDWLKQFRKVSNISLKRKGLSISDVAMWAWIVSARDPEIMAERLLIAQCKLPMFLFIHVLKGKITRIRTLNQLLIRAWKFTESRGALYMTGNSATRHTRWVRRTRRRTTLSNEHFSVEEAVDNGVMMICLLLKHARQHWAAALVTLSHMVMPIMQAALGHSPSIPIQSDSSEYRMLCQVLQQMLDSLSLSSKESPWAAMAHNWHAQKVLLEWAGQFSPPLILSQTSYRAVTQVLGGQMKSEREAMVAKLRARSWPPWRIDQDGMDAQRSMEDDLSRVILAVMRKSEAGYGDDVHDQVLKILGGQEPDGTPTIQKRTLYRPRYEATIDNLPDQINPVLWAARIESTRDVQEAWSAFVKFNDNGGGPSMWMYFNMFKKIFAEAKRQGLSPRNTARQKDYLPGDGWEVTAPLDDNFSKFYQLHLQPPTIDQLYKQMLQSTTTRPALAFLDFLVERARKPEDAFRYLSDSNEMDPRAIAFLMGTEELSPTKAKSLVRGGTLAAFISMLCRFIKRVNDGPRAAKPLTLRTIHKPTDQPLLHCVKLLQQSQIEYVPAWYALFKHLSRRNIIIDATIPGDPENDFHSWRILVASLEDFRKIGLELTPKGFQKICAVLEKAVLARFSVPDKGDHFIKGSPELQYLINEFAMMTVPVQVDGGLHMPKLLHPLTGVQLHAYVRVLGLVEDYDQIITTLKWMLEHHEGLYEVSSLRRGGVTMTQRTFIAMKVFLNGTKYEAMAERLFKSVAMYEAWSWPSDAEAQRYIDVWYEDNRTMGLVKGEADHGDEEDDV